nr:Uncharacterised protein [Streptococcus thermophilus]
MRKFTTAAVAAATALSLSVIPATAQSDNDKNDISTTGGTSVGSDNGSAKDDKKSSDGSAKDDKKSSDGSAKDDKKSSDGSAKDDKKSSEGSAKGNGSSDAKTPIHDKIKDNEGSSKLLGSSYKSDEKNGWSKGLTAEILIGFGIGAAALALFNFLKNFMSK